MGSDDFQISTYKTDSFFCPKEKCKISIAMENQRLQYSTTFIYLLAPDASCPFPDVQVCCPLYHPRVSRGRPVGSTPVAPANQPQPFVISAKKSSSRARAKARDSPTSTNKPKAHLHPVTQFNATLRCERAFSPPPLTISTPIGSPSALQSITPFRDLRRYREEEKGASAACRQTDRPADSPRP